MSAVRAAPLRVIAALLLGLVAVVPSAEAVDAAALPWDASSGSLGSGRGTTAGPIAAAPGTNDPVAVFTATPDRFSVAFDATGSSAGGGTIASYGWDFGDGTTGTGPAPTKTFAGEGTYTVTLTVTDPRGGEGTMSQRVGVGPNRPPVAAFTAPSRDLRVLVDASPSQDPDGEIVSYVWDLGDGTTATGPRLPVKAYARPGTYTVSLTVADNDGVTDTATRELTLSAGRATAAGAQLPVLYDLQDLPGAVRFVAPRGSDASGDGSEQDPFRTVRRALGAAEPGDSIVLRGGTYSITENSVSIDKADLTITAYPGEVPLFDGSAPAAKALHSEGSLRWVEYQPMVAGPGEGLSITQLPQATFDDGGNPTGLAKERGWRCVESSGFEDFSTSGLERDLVVEVPYRGARVFPFSSGSGCPAGTTARVITGFYPDQVWVGDRRLVQVLEKSLVRPGTFYVPRGFATDGAPSLGRLYLSEQDAADIEKVRVSQSSGNFLHLAASGITVRGIRVERHSPAWPLFALTVTAKVDRSLVEDVEFDSVASIATKFAGGDASDQSGLGHGNRMNRVTVDGAGWIGMSAVYQDGLEITNSVFRNANPDREIATAPKSGGIKATKTHGMRIIGSEVVDNNGHGIWWDQSNYDATLANSLLAGNSDSALVYEISHGLTMVNNLVLRESAASASPTVRLAGASGTKLVNNTIVGGQVVFALVGDPRSKTYAGARPCAEHSQRYDAGGSIGSDCPPALTSDLDMARPGAFGGGTNLTPGLTWRPSADLVVNNVFANPVNGSGGICPAGWAACIKGYVGPSDDPDVVIPTNAILPPDLVLNGNVYQSADQAMEVLVQSGGSGGFAAAGAAGVRANLGAGWYGLTAEADGLSGTGWVDARGGQTPALAQRNGQAAPVPTDRIVNEFLPAGTRWYGVKRQASGGDQPPVPSFGAVQEGWSVAVDARGSTDPDGVIGEYLWDFGDGSPVVRGVTASHTFAAAGSFTITLGVVDPSHGRSTVSRTVIVEDPHGRSFARATFDRDEASGLGAPDAGGSWSLGGSAAGYAVDGGDGLLRLLPGHGRRALLGQVSSRDAEAAATVGFSGPITGGGVEASVMPRAIAGTAAYRARILVKADGAVTLGLARMDAEGVQTSLATTSDVLRGLSTADRIHIKARVSGASPTRIRAKVWVDGQPEPAGWQVEAFDSTPGLQAAGGVGFAAFQSSSASTPVTVRMDDFTAERAG